jgi:3-acetyloctanal synthase
LAEICTPFTERTLATRLRLVQVTREKTHLAPFTHYPVCSELIDFLRHLSGAVKVPTPILEQRHRALAESRPTSTDLLGEGVSQPMSLNYFFHHLNRTIEDLITRQNYSYIGVFDVGRGGISAVRNLARVRPGFSGWYGRALMGDALMAVPAIAVTEMTTSSPSSATARRRLVTTMTETALGCTPS